MRNILILSSGAGDTTDSTCTIDELQESFDPYDPRHVFHHVDWKSLPRYDIPGQDACVHVLVWVEPVTWDEIVKLAYKHMESEMTIQVDQGNALILHAAECVVELNKI